MSGISRRNFLRMLGQGSAALGMGMGLSGVPWAKAWCAQSQEASDIWDWDAWEFYHPGKYNAQDQKVLDEFQAQIDQINKNISIDVDDLISGKLEGRPGIIQAKKITRESMLDMANRFVGDNPLFTDKEYAKKTVYGDMVAMPLMCVPGTMCAMPKAKGFGDYMVVSDLNHSRTYHKPFFEGDTLYLVIDKQQFEDITPARGSHYRTFTMSGRGRAFNQRGELVAEGAQYAKESFRRRIDPAKRNPDGAHAWESPDWWGQHGKARMYTDADWEYIISMWKKEKIRGSEVLYWDDVNIGDEPTPTCVGPALTDVEMDMMGTIPQWSTDIRKNVLDPKVFPKMVKNKQGIYVLPEYLEKKPANRPFSTESGGTPELSNRDGRAVFMNTIPGKCVADMLYSWMGDAGWLQRIGWDIMYNPPGYENFGIPDFPDRLKPDLFDKFPYMEKVPNMKGKRADYHGMEGDVIISKAYLTDKYQKDGDYLADFTWWCETLEGYIIEEGFATVKLPKKSGT